MSPEQAPLWARELKVQVSRIETVICGPYGQPEKGLITRVDAMEKDIRSVKRVAWAAILGAASVFGAWILSPFTKGTP